MELFMLREWWLNVFDRVTKRGRSALNARRNVSKIGEGLRRCFTNRYETSTFYSEKIEHRAEMWWAYRPLARDAYNAYIQWCGGVKMSFCYLFSGGKQGFE